MVAKRFGMVFEKIALSEEVKSALRKARVTYMGIDRGDRILRIELRSGKIMDESILEELKKSLRAELPGVLGVEIQLGYDLPAGTDFPRFMENYRTNLERAVAELSPVCGVIIKDSTWETGQDCVSITVKNKCSYYLESKKAHNALAEKISCETGRNFAVKFLDAEETREEREEYFRGQIEREQSAMAAAEIRSVREESRVPETKVILGKEITEAPSPVADAKTEGETRAVRGEIFDIEKKEIRGEKYIVSFGITDGEDSTSVKFFVPKKVFDGGMSDRLSAGAWVRVRGEVQFDKYAGELNMMAKDICAAERPPLRGDECETKRVELHLHTNMSRMDGITTIKDYIERAALWGHKAIAVTDHGVVQAFPEAHKWGKKKGVKILYGVEAYIVDDLGAAVSCPRGQTTRSEFVVFDIETTGLYKEKDEITEIGAVRIVDGEIKDRFSTLVNPGIPLSPEIVRLTGLTDEMLAGAPGIEKVLPEFLNYAGSAVLAAHNASFDVGFIRAKCEALGLPPVENTVLDTLELSRSLLPELKHHKLNNVCEALGIELMGHHRAVNDAEAAAGILRTFFGILRDKGVETLEGINAFAGGTISFKKLRPYHAVILVKNQKGFRNLYELISESHLEYFFKKRPRIPKSLLAKKRDGLLVGSACEAGEVYRALLEKRPKEYIDNLVSFYDYLEIQPLGNNKFMIESPKYGGISSTEDIMEINRRVAALGESHGKPVVATCDAHFLDPGDSVFRSIIMLAEGFPDYDRQAPLFYRTTGEMLEEFRYLGDEKAYEIVVENTNRIADMIEDAKPLPDEKFPPKMEGAEGDLRRHTLERAAEVYGDPLPKVVGARLERELNSIINNGYAALYMIARKLVQKSMSDGYLVGSRGSVGSSLVATMAGITEVNPLPPHYVCPQCKYSDFDSKTVKKFAMDESSGCDMPDEDCPICGHKLSKEGHDIPFETFLGFEGDKEPDIDLNFSGDYQQKAHDYTEELFGKGHVFKAGTIGTLADKTAYGFVKKYSERKSVTLHNAELKRLANGVTGAKRTTGQHPGGLIIVPEGHEIYEVCPVQHPADDQTTDIITTHFDYHSIDQNLLKLDLLGHDDPTVIHMLQEITGVDPRSVPLDDPVTMSIFKSPEALGVSARDINCETGTLGIPEFGTKFVRQMLLDTRPESFSDLIRISGLSHGTDVWVNNAQELITKGVIKLQDSISTRDGIMIYLINKGVEKKKAFKIMEKIRKKDSNVNEEDIADMRAARVPEWYISSCQKISYMFPKAHAAAYVMMSFRIAYFKVNYPKAYYAAYFTVKASDDFDYSAMCRGAEDARAAMREIQARGMEATAKEKDKYTVLEIVMEFYARGFKFSPVDIYKSDAKKFIVTEEGLLPPLNSLQGLGGAAAESIVEARKNGEFKTIEDLKLRTTVSKTLVELLKANGILKGIPDTNQLSLF